MSAPIPQGYDFAKHSPHASLCLIRSNTLRRFFCRAYHSRFACRKVFSRTPTSLTPLMSLTLLTHSRFPHAPHAFLHLSHPSCTLTSLTPLTSLNLTPSLHSLLSHATCTPASLMPLMHPRISHAPLAHSFPSGREGGQKTWCDFE